MKQWAPHVFSDRRRRSDGLWALFEGHPDLAFYRRSGVLLKRYDPTLSSIEYLVPYWAVCAVEECRGKRGALRRLLRAAIRDPNVCAALITASEGHCLDDLVRTQGAKP